jgi:hypothetical protein
MQKMLGENGRPADDPFFSTSPGHMTKLLDHFDNKYGRVAGYLEQGGVPGVILGKLKSKLS